MRIAGFCLIALSVFAIFFEARGPLDILGSIVFILVGVALIKKGSKTTSKASGASAVKKASTSTNNVQSANDNKTSTLYPKQEKVMVCAECGRKYPANHVYCDECGSLLKEDF